MPPVELYDTTLRDGTQREGISLSVADKLKITRKIDELGIPFIEGGYPGSNPKDAEYFVRVRSLPLKNATVCAFGSTRRANSAAEHDTNLRALIDARTKVVTLVAKSWDMQVLKVLGTTLDENVAMIADSVRYLRRKGLRVFYDAEHFFDGFRANKDYALRTLLAAAEAGAERLILCDTNGGTLPEQVKDVVRIVGGLTGVSLGIHAHNDAEVAVANSLMAVQAGAYQVQGTINGYGERCGNANLISIIPNLQLKQQIEVVSADQLANLSTVSHYVAEVANLSPDTHQPYVGVSAFAHKAGLHVDAVMKAEETYQHVDPKRVGNQKRVVISDLAGRQNVVYKAAERGLDLIGQKETARAVLDQVKRLESRGYQFDGAEASFDLLIHRTKPDYSPPFELIDFMVVVEKHRRRGSLNGDEEVLSEATVKVRVDGEVKHTAAEGNGPVNALDAALRKVLVEFYPSLAAVKLIDYKVRILDGAGGTGALTRVVIESSDGERQWSTVGCSENVIEASWLALADSLEYWLVTRNGHAEEETTEGSASDVEAALASS